MASSMEALNCRVNELQQENAELRAQRAKLKLLLIQHRDCDVTRGLKRECSVGRGGGSRCGARAVNRLV